MGQRRIEDTIVGNAAPLGAVGNTSASIILGGSDGPMSAPNTAKNLRRGLTSERRMVEVLLDADGRVVGQKVFVGEREQLGWSLDYVQRVNARRLADGKQMAADEKRRQTARARAAA